MADDDRRLDESPVVVPFLECRRGDVRFGGEQAYVIFNSDTGGRVSGLRARRSTLECFVLFPKLFREGPMKVVGCFVLLYPGDSWDGGGIVIVAINRRAVDRRR